MKTGGDCYQANGRYLVDNIDDNLLLVHGEVHHQVENITFGHCWVEDGDIVIDNSNGRKLKIPKELYYAIGRIGEIGNYFKYTPTEAMTKMFKTGHWGPWDLKTKY